MNMAEAIDLAEAAHPSSPRTVYVVMRTEGEYSDREVESLMVFYNEEAAKHYVDNIEEELNRFHNIKMTIDEYIENKKNNEEYINDHGHAHVYEEIKNINISLLGNDFPLLKDMVSSCEHYEYVHPMEWNTDDYGQSKFYIEKVKLII